MRHLYEHNIPELKHWHGARAGNLRGCFGPLLNTRHPEFGEFNISDLGFPTMRLLDIHWNVPDDLVIHESEPSDTVDINFVLEGGMEGNFRGLRAQFGLTKGTHNLKYTPNQRSSHSANRQNVRMFVIAMEKQHFCNLIADDSSWSDATRKKVERNEDFLAAEQFLTTTPQMRALIDSILRIQEGPTSRLLAQSMSFELLARQIEQISQLHHATDSVANIPGDELEKLHAVRNYVDRHFLDELSLSGLSRVGTLNEFKLKKGFKAVFGVSVIQYARELRMHYAQKLLCDHGMCIEEVSVKLGYQYPNHFSAAFKKYFGVSPSARP